MQMLGKVQPAEQRETLHCGVHLVPEYPVPQVEQLFRFPLVQEIQLETLHWRQVL